MLSSAFDAGKRSLAQICEEVSHKKEKNFYPIKIHFPFANNCFVILYFRKCQSPRNMETIQAVSGAALAAVGLWYDDWVIGQSPLTPKLLNVLGYTTGVENNDKAFTNAFPFVAAPHSGFGICGGYTPPKTRLTDLANPNAGGLGIGAPELLMAQNYPNPFASSTTLRYHLASSGQVTIDIYDLSGKLITKVMSEAKSAGDYEVRYDAGNLPSGFYLAAASFNGQLVQTLKINCVK